MRSASLRLQSDLDNLTVPVRPFTRVEQGSGYFHYREGAGWDGTKTIDGDTDDVLAFTSRNDVEHFTGKYTFPGVGTFRVTSPEAELMWWPQYVDLNDDGALTPDETMIRVLHRRVLVIRPDLNPAAGGPWFTLPSKFNAGMTDYNTSNQGDLQTLAMHLRMLYNEFDVSVRLVRVLTGSNLTVQVYANSLSDLTRPENRFLRHPMVFRIGNNYSLAPWPSLPYAIDTNANSQTRLEVIPLNGNRRGEDVILSSILAFDVRAFDPTALVAGPSGLSLVPSDNGWTPNIAVASPIGRGGFVDLNYSRQHAAVWNVNANSRFSGAPQSKSGITVAEQPFYDTWSFHFEQNGANDNGVGAFDEGTNGLDDDGTNGTDDPGERETSPPYPIPLRGLQTMLRVYEPDTRQVRQSTVVSEFVPE